MARDVTVKPVLLVNAYMMLLLLPYDAEFKKPTALSVALAESPLAMLYDAPALIPVNAFAPVIPATLVTEVTFVALA
jgi:hypothetical protein